MKKVLFFAAAAAMMTACSNTDELTGLQVQENNQQTPIAFDVYAGKTITRAGLPGGKYTEGTQDFYGITNKSLTEGSHAKGVVCVAGQTGEGVAVSRDVIIHKGGAVVDLP